jgi:hypothetical protein
MIKFTGRRYSALSRALIYLYSLKVGQGQTDTWLPVGAIAAGSGVNYDYLCGRCKTWRGWHFLTAQIKELNGKPTYAFQIGAKGIEFVNDLRTKYPTEFDRFVKEVRAYRAGKVANQ